MKAFSERNPIVIAVTGLVVLILIGLGTFYHQDLPIIGGGTTYTVKFTDAGGLQPNDDVRVAGVKVGSVEGISLDGGQVKVSVRINDGVWLGDQSTAAIGIKTLLGQEYVALTPQGDSKLNSHTAIPTSRTSTPIDVNAALNQLSTQVGQINTQTLATSFNTLSDAFANTSSTVHSTLTGLSALAQTIASRDAKLKQLATNTQAVTASLAGSNQQFATLINDGAALLGELQARSAAITELLNGTRNLATQLAGLVKDNNATLGKALASLGKVTDILTANQGNLKQALKLIGPYYSLLNDAVGNGPWMDIYLCGLFDAKGAPILDSTAPRNCNPRQGAKP